jgi:hypothetical protein
MSTKRSFQQGRKEATLQDEQEGVPFVCSFFDSRKTPFDVIIFFLEIIDGDERRGGDRGGGGDPAKHNPFYFVFTL